MPKQIQGSQRDFSFGEVDPALKRNDEHPARKGGLRQMVNARILNTGGTQNRSGRRALYPITNGGKRTDRFTISAGNIFDIQFAAGRLKIIDSTGTAVANFTTQGNGAALPWASAANINSISFAIFNLSIYVCFGHAMRPQVVSWDGVSTWTIADYTEAIGGGGQKRTPFYRISPQNITLQPFGITGVVNIVFSAPVLTAGRIGTRIRYCGRQIQILTVTSPTRGTAIVIENLPPAQSIVASNPVGTFSVGDVVDGSISGATGIVVQTPTQQSINFANVPASSYVIGGTVSGGTSGATGVVTGIYYNGGIPAFGIEIVYVNLSSATLFVLAEVVTGVGSNVNAGVNGAALVVQIIQNSNIQAPGFSVNDVIAGPSGAGTITSASTTTPQAVTVWDDEIINAFQGYPAACFTDQFRLGFCNFPTVPGGIGWSAINSPNDLYANDASSPDNSIFEIAPNKVVVYFVVPGPEGSEFIFCDKRVYYIPISPTNPLRPGSVGFMLLSGDGAAPVQPRLSQEAILYINAGQNSVMAVIATGAYNRPFNTKNLSDFHSHLFNSIQAIATPSADGTFNERYAYVLNGDGSIAVGKYQPDSLQAGLPVIGWGPWSGAGAVSWISASAADVLFTSSYFGAGVVEVLDDSQYLDCALPVNAAPAAFAPPGGKGPLWFIPSQTVDLMDQGTRSMGIYWIDPNGFIIPQFSGGEDLTIASLVAGQPWTMTVEPFAPLASPGADMHQRMTLRQVAYFAVSFMNSTGFMFAGLFSGKQTKTSPVLGAITHSFRVPAWNQGEDPTKPPLLREWTEQWPPPGSSFDPRAAIIKDTPGPLIIEEIGMEISL